MHIDADIQARMDRFQERHERKIRADVSAWLDSEYGEGWESSLLVVPVARTRICHGWPGPGLRAQGRVF